MKLEDDGFGKAFAHRHLFRLPEPEPFLVRMAKEQAAEEQKLREQDQVIQQFWQIFELAYCQVWGDDCIDLFDHFGLDNFLEVEFAVFCEAYNVFEGLGDPTQVCEAWHRFRAEQKSVSDTDEGFDNSADLSEAFAVYFNRQSVATLPNAKAAPTSDYSSKAQTPDDSKPVSGRASPVSSIFADFRGKGQDPTHSSGHTVNRQLFDKHCP